MTKTIQKKSVLGLIGTAAGLAGLLLATAPTGAAAASPSNSTTGTAGVAAVSWHAYSDTGFSGPDTYFSGNVGECKYVGASWNDRVRSARAEVATRTVELWDNSNCTGGAITIDGSGYNSIGLWVSAYRVTHE